MRSRPIDRAAPVAIAGAGAALLATLAERAFALVGPGARAPDPRALPWLFAGFACLALASLVLTSLFALPATLLRERAPRLGRVLAAVLAALVAAWPARRTAAALVSGDWIAEQSWAPAFGVALAAAITLGVAGLVAVDRRWAHDDDRAPRRARAVTALLLATAIGGLAGDALVMPGLHREFHLLVITLAVLAGTLAARRLAGRLRRTRATRRIALASALLLVAAPVLWTTMSARTRSLLVLESRAAAAFLRLLAPPRAEPILADELARLAAPSPPLARATPPRATPPAKPWNIVLVVVDTLRADALPPVRRDGRRSAADDDSPQLDRFIAGSFRFRASYAQATRTKRSMPAMFQSLYGYEDPHRHGEPLGEAIAALGRTPVAVVPNILFERREARAKQLLDGFSQVVTYDKPEMAEQHERTVSLLRRVGDRPFFAWLHYYPMHMPGFAGHLLNKADGSWPERYRRSLRWLDGELARLFASLDELGHADDTIVILCADHGEGLGAHGVAQHGPTVFDEEVRTPLFIHIPGQAGREIDAVVGNVDLVPTIYELLGAAPDLRHRGRSLLPLLDDPAAAAGWDQGYYVENLDGKIVALVHGTRKLVYDREARVFHHFDVERDPTEDRDLFGIEPDADLELRRRLLYANPGLFAEELDTPATLALLRARLAEQDPRTPSEALPFLLALAADTRDRDCLRESRRIFDDTDDELVRLLVLRHLYARDRKGWSAAVLDHLREIRGTDDELVFVDGLARQDPPAFDPGYAARRLRELAERRELAAWRPWLRLARRWPNKAPRQFAAPLLAMLEALPPEHADAPVLLPLILGNLATLRRESRGIPVELPRAVAALLDDPAPLIRSSAVRALGRVGGASEVPALERAARGGDLEVRQAALWALSEVQGKDAIPLIVEQAAAEDLLTVAAIDILARLRSRDALPFLDEVGHSHYNELVRKRARKAAKRLRKSERAPAQGGGAARRG